MIPTIQTEIREVFDWLSFAQEYSKRSQQLIVRTEFSLYIKCSTPEGWVHWLFTTVFTKRNLRLVQYNEMLSLPSSPNNAACALLLSVKTFNDHNNNDNNSDNFFLAHYIKNLNALTKSSRHLGSRILYINDYSVKTIQRTRLACLKIKSEKKVLFLRGAPHD